MQYRIHVREGRGIMEKDGVFWCDWCFAESGELVRATVASPDRRDHHLCHAHAVALGVADPKHRDDDRYRHD